LSLHSFDQLMAYTSLRDVWVKTSMAFKNDGVSVGDDEYMN